LEKNEPTLPIRSPELKPEMAANIGLIANNLVQRIEGCGQAGGARNTGLEPSLREKAWWKVVRHADLSPPPAYGAASYCGSS
jgi:hypothetical protein